MNSSRWSRWTTIAAVLLLAVIAAVVSYSHMYELALRHGEPEWRAALFPLSVDGMIVASSMTLLSDARNGRKGGLLPWSLLIIGSAASLAANVAVADPTMWSRIIHAWPSFALIGAYELLMRAFRTAARCVRSASAEEEQLLTGSGSEETPEAPDTTVVDNRSSQSYLHVVPTPSTHATSRDSWTEGASEPAVPPSVQVEAWKWALKNRRKDGKIPTGKEIGNAFGRKERWGRLIKEWGEAGRFDQEAMEEAPETVSVSSR
ncbi:DUF2637 domain-containing protein [Nocardiopsis metallicus]|uniref:DUF2637 domain-containing protein n=1 Tax=Nocardiopsis metallicus TaxID=179819 RepID=A0A840WEG6_9ACTN|nr:DUF2637 domain-containing protein [Nocardiopsis metallicus]MBB5494514.1 hypothetical protein [Nocardiopsis metallicus]